MAERTPVKEALTKVADLSTKCNGQQWKVCARVIKKYDKKVTSNNKVFFKVLLEDDSGKIEALTFGKENVERLFPLINLKKVYYISNGRLKEVNTKFENVGHEFEIYLDETTTVTPCSNPADCPTSNSPYTPLCELPAASNRFTDILGQLTEIGSMETKIVRDRPTQLLKIRLTDNRDGCKVDVALWGQNAVDFKKIPVGKVIAIKNVKVNQYQGRLELSSTAYTVIDYNPSDGEAYSLRHHTERPSGGTATTDKSDEIRTISATGSRMTDVRRRLLVTETKESLSGELSENMTKDEDSDDSEDTITPKRSARPRIESDTENEADDENEADEDENEADEDENEADEDENEADEEENEADEDENEADEDENEADEDENEDEISPVKARRRQMFQSDSESDTEITPSNRLRRKRRSNTNIDSEEGETYNSKNHKPESDSGRSQKKKFRRILLPESSQELDPSCKRRQRRPNRSCSVLDETDSDTETVRTDSQETVIYNPEDVDDSLQLDFEAYTSNSGGPIVSSDEVPDVDDSSNGSDTTAGDDGTSDESSNESYSSDSDLEDYSHEEALKDSIFQPLRAVYQLIVLQAAGEEEAVQEVKEEEYESRLLESFDKQLESRLNLCQSQAWCERAATAVLRFPEFIKVSDRDDLTGGDFDHLEDCEVCKRRAHKWKYEVDFRGEPYNRVTFSQEDGSAEEEDGLDLRFKMGRFCYERTKAYHRLYHWKFNLYQKCKKKLENVNLHSLQKDKNLILKNFSFLKKWMHRVTEDYTLDGEKRRGNRRYKREYGEMD